MILSNLELDGTLALDITGETKTVTMLTDTSTVPYMSYYTMPSGYADWLSITLAGNIFSVTALNNLFSASARSVVVQFCCLPTSAGTLQTLNVTVTQAADTVSLTFDPTSVSLAYTAGATDDVTVTGIPSGAAIELIAPTWLEATMTTPTTLTVTAALNEDTVARTGSVTVLVDTRPFYLVVTQAANTAALTFDPASVSLAYTAGATDDVTVTGIPSGETVEIVAPDWLTATILSGTLTITALENTTLIARSDSVALTVAGRTFYITVTQAANAYQYGPLTLNESSHSVLWSGSTFTVSATAMPSNATVLDCVAKEAGSCATCGDTENKVSFTRVNDTSFSVTVAPQDIFDGIERSFVLTFSAGNESAAYTITQAAPPAVHRLYGTGDKFLKNVTSVSAPTYVVSATVQTLFSELKTTGWVARASLKAPVLIEKERTGIVQNIEAFEAFKVYHDRENIGSTPYQKVSMGGVVYRFTFDAAAYGLELRGIRFIVRSDAFCAKGIRAALETTNSTDSPSTDWLTVREGTGGFFKAGCAPRVLNTADDLYYGAAETVVFDGLNITVGASTRLYLYLTMEDYLGISNGWVYGSGIVTPGFDFYVDALISGVLDNATIAQSSIQEDAYPLVADGEVISPEADATAGQATREIAVQNVVFGTSPLKNDPTPIDASASIAYLAARLAESGMTAANTATLVFREWQKKQLGLTCSLCRRIVGATVPFEQHLAQLVTPLSVNCAFPVNYLPTLLRLTHRAGSETLTISGADVRLAVYWIPFKMVTLLQLAPLFALPGFCTGASTLTAGTLTATLIGAEKLPASIAAETEIAIKINTPSVRWGTLLIVPWIARVTATSLTANEQIGLTGTYIEDNEIIGTGWVPDIQLEV